MTPDTYTIKEHMIDVGDSHTLYVHEWGNKDAKTTIVNLHGGPGGGTSDGTKRYYDPSRQHVIFFDQRGCGRSTPTGSRENNTTDKQINDITKILDILGVEQAILRGASWGCTLALLYAIKQPTRVSSVVVNGVFAASQQETDWLDHGMFKAHFPDVWQEFVDSTPAEHQNNPTAYHAQRALSGTAKEAKQSAYAYENLEAPILRLDDRYSAPDYETYDPSAIALELHYLTQRCFLPDNYIMENAKAITAPVYLVQGRYDMVCPPQAAFELHQQLPNSELIWTLDGHNAGHEGWNIIRTLLIELSK